MEGKFYDKKMVRSGNVIEVYDYERCIKYGEQNNDKGRAGKSDVSDEDKQVNRGKVLAKAKKTVRRLINANISEWGERPKFITLTFEKHVTDPKTANYQYKKFRQRLEYRIERKIKYVACVEFMKSGRIHYHVVFFNLPYIDANEFWDMWGNGFVQMKAIDEVDNVGAYVTKYMTKDNDDERLRGEKCYFSSRGLKGPETIIDKKEIEKLEASLSGNKVYEAEFDNDFTGNIKYQQFNLDR